MNTSPSNLQGPPGPAEQKRDQASGASERALLSGEERFRLLFENAKDYAIYELNPEGYIQGCSPGGERITGYRAEEILGKHFSIFYPPDAVNSGKPNLELKAAAAEGRLEDKSWRIRKDGSPFWANFVTVALRDRAGNLCGFATLTHDLTELKQAEDSLRQLSTRLLQLQDEERRRLARDLHDSTVQILAAVSLNLAVLTECIDLSQNPRASEALYQAIVLADQAAHEVRDFSHLLHPPLLDEAGLAEAVRWYVNEFVRQTNIRVDLRVSPELPAVPPEMQTALFRIVQEGLANVYRHSGSSRAEIRLSPDQNQIVLEVIDHGKGLPTVTREQNYSAPAALGVGILGMQERVRQLGGRLEFGPANPGTIVRAILPLPAANPGHDAGA